MTHHAEDVTKKRILNGMLSVLIDPAAVADRSTFERETLAFVDWVKASPPRAGFEPVRIAGEPEREKFAQRTANGIPVDATTWTEILEAGRKLGVDQEAVRAAAGQV
jgi:uncharacterized oxidoreductase